MKGERTACTGRGISKGRTPFVRGHPIGGRIPPAHRKNPKKPAVRKFALCANSTSSAKPNLGKTPHMHLCFVPLTEDGRLSAKDIVGNKKKLIWWQDEFWKHMVKKYPELERGESASQTGREHLPPRLYKEAVHLNAQRDRLMELLSGTNVLNAKSRAAEVAELLDEYIPGVEKFKTRLHKAVEKNKALTEENEDLKGRLAKAEDAGRERIAEKMERFKRDQEYAELLKTVERIPREILEAYAGRKCGREVPQQQK